MLYVESPNFETPSAVHQLLIAVSENCQMLKLLTLISPRRAPVLDMTEENNASQRVGMDTLKPLLACANLTSFEIIHQLPLLLKQEDVEILATRWPSLETLNLNSEPLNLVSPELTLEALLPFAQHCNRLSALSFFSTPPQTLSHLLRRLHSLYSQIYKSCLWECPKSPNQ